MRMLAALFLCGLSLHTVSCVEVMLATGGTPVNGKLLTARTGDSASVRCQYSELPDFGQFPTLSFKAKDATDEEDVYVFGNEPQGRWGETGYNVEKDHVSSVFIKLTISAVSTLDEGQYICSLKDSNRQALKEDSAEIKVAANVDQLILDGVDNGIYKVSEDNSITPVICTAINGSSPEMQLQIEGTDPIDLVVEITTTSRGTEYTGSHNYRFSPEQDGKEIKCEATVAGFDTMTATAKLQIQGLPVVTCPDKVKGNIGDKVSIPCTIVSKPKAMKSSISWTVENNGDSFSADATDADLGYSSRITDVGDGYKVDLDLTILDEQSYTRYSLGAENAAGYGHQSVKVEKKPSIDTTVQGNGAGEVLPFTFCMFLGMLCCQLFM